MTHLSQALITVAASASSASPATCARPCCSCARPCCSVLGPASHCFISPPPTTTTLEDASKQVRTKIKMTEVYLFFFFFFFCASASFGMMISGKRPFMNSSHTESSIAPHSLASKASDVAAASCTNWYQWPTCSEKWMSLGNTV